MVVPQFTKLIVAQQNAPTVMHAFRTTAAALLSYLAARLLRLPEPYWATMSTMIAMQSTLGVSWPASLQRFAGTAIGAVFGGALAAYFPVNIWAFGFAVFLVGILCVVLRIERSAYRYAGIELAIIALIPRTTGAWLTATHRFLEVSLGLAVGLLLSAIWPERETSTMESEAEKKHV